MTWLLTRERRPRTCRSQTSLNIWFSIVQWLFCLCIFSIPSKIWDWYINRVPMSCDLISALHSRRLLWIYSSSAPLWLRRPFIRSYKDFSNLDLMSIIACIREAKKIHWHCLKSMRLDLGSYLNWFIEWHCRQSTWLALVVLSLTRDCLKLRW